VFFAQGTAMLPAGFYDGLPRLVGTLLGNSVILVIILVIIMEQIIFRERIPEKESSITS